MSTTNPLPEYPRTPDDATGLDVAQRRVGFLNPPTDSSGDVDRHAAPQDIPSTPAFDQSRAPAQAGQLETEAREIIDEHRFSPAVVTYVPFNEGWGEWDLAVTKRITTDLENYDPTRLMNAHSGYNCCVSKEDPGTGDILDGHVCTGPDAPRPSTPACPSSASSAHRPAHARPRVQPRRTVLRLRTGLQRRAVERPLHRHGPRCSAAHDHQEPLRIRLHREHRCRGRVQRTPHLRPACTEGGHQPAARGALLGASRNLNAAAGLTLGHVRSFQVTTPGLTDRYLRRELHGPHRGAEHLFLRRRPPGRLVPDRRRTPAASPSSRSTSPAATCGTPTAWCAAHPTTARRCSVRTPRSVPDPVSAARGSRSSRSTSPARTSATTRPRCTSPRAVVAATTGDGHSRDVVPT